MMFRLFYIFIVWIFAFASLQAQGFLNDVDNKTVHAVMVDIHNVQSVNEALVRAHIKVKEGQEYDPALADQSIRSLYRSGLFDYVKVGLAKSDEDGLDVLFTVYPKYKLSQILFEGNKKAPTKKLRKEIEIDLGQPLDEAKVKTSADKIFDFYQKKGFYNVSVEYRLDKNSETGLGVVVFEIDEGAKHKIASVNFTGNNYVKKSKLKKLMKTSSWHFFSFFTGSGYIKAAEFRDDIDRVKQYYKDQGFLDVKINESDIQFSYSDSGRVRITINIHEGKQYFAGNVDIKGNTLYTQEELVSQLRLKQGDILSASVVDQDTEALRDFYGSAGYLETYVVAERKSNLDDDTISVTYRIRESEKYYLEGITLQGNTNTKSAVIIRELALAPGDVFDLVRMKNSEARLKNTRFFDEVNLTSESTDIPNRKNLKITVKEGRTGSVSFGGAISSVEKYLVFAELSQSNFDIFSYRTFFRGGGQKFRLRFSLGELSNEIVLAFEEPWMFQRELAFGFEVYRTRVEYYSSLYDELRMGFEVYFRKWFFDAIEGRVSHRLEQVNLFNVKSNAPAFIQREAGKRTVSKLGLTLTYDSRDDLLVPTQGTRLQLITEVAGGPALGPTKFVRVEGRAGHWIPTFDFQDQVFAVFGRAGSIGAFGGESVPFFERYFLGGPDSLRGFDFREAGPKFGTGEPAGGQTFGFASAEYSFEIVKPVRFVAFYDIGFLNSGARDFDLRNYVHDAGIGLRIFILGAPMRLDLGFPLRGGKGSRFHWSFGTSF